MSRRGGLSFGVDLTCVPNIAESVAAARADSFDFVCSPICHPRYRRHLLSASPSSAGGHGDQRGDQPWTRSDVILESGQWSTLVVGKLSPWLSLGSPCEAVRVNSSRAFWQEMQWAVHLALPAVLLPPPAGSNFAHYAHFINEVVLRVTSLQLWLRVPLSYGAAEAEDAVDSWSVWNNVRILCDHSEHLSVALELTADLPDDARLERWAGEPVKALIVPTSVFMTNRNGYPVLSQRHQRFVHVMFRLNAQVVISGAPHHSNGLVPYRQYITYLHNQIPAMTPQEEFEAPYWDYLQVPLQPLSDNLESQTYETFERDPVKYVRYEQAMEAALVDMKAAGRQLPIVVMVVGAGRGPLVAGALRVSEKAGVPIRVYAVEKNPNALVTLRNKKVTLGWQSVTIVEADMRSWVAPELADMLVSELLGSFGDNELSPECLDGAQRFLKRDGGISIPYSYTSYIAPVTTSKLYTEVRAFGDVAHFETPFIVKFHNFHMLSETRPCFTFTHPNWKENIDNTRYTHVAFTSKAPAIVHGIGGYFQVMLYKDINLSINPPTFSEGMFSWFPVLFPLRTPVVVPENGTFEVHMWRQMNRNKVWYEWCITGSSPTPIHNPNGRSYFISLF